MCIGLILHVEVAEMQKLISMLSMVRTVGMGEAHEEVIQVSHSITHPSRFGFSLFLPCYWHPPFCTLLHFFFLFFYLFLENVSSIYIFMIPG